MAMTSNPDWSRESMKTILAWGWVSPTGQDHVGRRKDGTHDRMAYDLGLGTWIQAVKAGWVRYIIFSDNHMGLTLIITPNTLMSARKLVQRPDVLTVSFEWLVDGKIEQSGSLPGKLALAAIRAKGRGIGREQNPPHFADGTKSIAWGLIDPAGVVHEGRHIDNLDIYSHDKLAQSLGFRNAPEAINRGWTRYAVFSGYRNVVRLIGSAGIPWARAASNLQKMMRQYPVESLALDLYDKHGERARTIGIDGEAEVEAQLRELARAKNPLVLTDTHRSQARGNKFNVLVEMTPMEFLRLTTVDDRQIKEIMDSAKPLATYNDAAASERNIIPCFLTLDISSGQAKVMGHEGRHRAAALFMNGEEGVGLPVYLRVTDAHPGQAKKMLAGLPGGEKQWMWDTTYLWGWDEIPEMLIGQFKSTVKVPKSRFKVVEPYVQERGKKARGL